MQKGETDMASLNYVAQLGNLTRDPELSYTPSQTAVCEFGLAVNRAWTGSDGHRQEETCFIEVKVFGARAESVNKYMSKGKPVLVTGYLAFETWQSDDGKRHSKHRIVARDVQFLPDGKRDRDPGQEG